MASFHLRGGLALIFLVSVLSLLLYTLPLRAEEVPAKPDEIGGVDGASAAQSVQSVKVVEGVATYYAKKYTGRRTSSGERYRPEKLTAAHPTLPLGTMVRVVNLTNLKEVVVRVNDRCRPKHLPVIDLSRSAAERLGFIRRGIVPVRMVTGEENIP